MALTTEQHDLLDAITAVLSADPQIEAAWLAGSLGFGGGDAFSDVDVLALAAGAPAREVGHRYTRQAAAIAPPALVNPLFDGRVLSVVTMDWRRFDISFVEPADLARYDALRLTVLFNKGDRSPPMRPPITYKPSPQTLLRIVNEFLRCLGLLVVAVGREEWLMAQSGMDILRRLTIDLMLEANGVGPADRGGALHLNRLLTPEQRSELESLPPMSPDRESVLAANAAIAAIFLPLARRLVAETGATWPSAFEAATRRHLQERLGLVIV
jgi:predicted nucleotidyltransferase